MKSQSLLLSLCLLLLSGPELMAQDTASPDAKPEPAKAEPKADSKPGAEPGAEPDAKNKEPKKPAAKGKHASLVKGLIKKTLPNIVKVYGAGGFRGIPAYGTGIVIDKRGMILTTWSVSLKTDFIHVVDNTGRRHEVVLHRASPALGVALLRTRRDAGWKSALSLGDSDKVKAGRKVLAFGNAFDVAVGVEKPGVVEGVISCRTELDARVGVVRGQISGKVFLMDAPNNPGTQGGPVVTLAGELVAVNGRVVESRSTNTSLNFAIPTKGLESWVQKGIKGWNKPQPAAEVPDIEDKKQLGISTGLRILRFHFNRPPPTYVDEVVPGSPADTAGFEPDDLIFEINGKTVRNVEEYELGLLDLKAGVQAVLTVKRGSNILKLKITPEARKVSKGKADKNSKADSKDGAKADSKTDAKPKDDKGEGGKDDDSKDDDSKDGGKSDGE